MYRFQLFEQLRRRNLRPTDAKLETGIATGRIPKPPVDAIGVRQYGPEQLEAFAAYLRNPPRPGRRPARQVVAAG